MSTSAPLLDSTPAPLQGWRELYEAAIAETDRNALPFRIHEAEIALARRDRELFALPDDNTDEREAIDHATYTLRALSYCLRLKKSYGTDCQENRIP